MWRYADFENIKCVRALRGFGSDARGNIAVIFGLSSMMIFLSIGAGLDLSRAYLAGQKLSEVATLACQYASRPSVLDTSTASYNGTNGGIAYVSQVTGFINTAWQSQKVNLSQTAGTPFSFTQGGAATVSLSASMPTTFMGIAGFQTIPIAVQSNCYDKPSSVIQRVPDSNNQFVVKESFEAGGLPGSYTFYKPDGSTGLQANPTGYSSANGYTGADGSKWHITGHCLEQDAGGVIKAAAFDGNYSVELDCDNGNGNKGNSAITSLVYLAAGSYELRYAYSSRVSFYDYDPTFICGTTAADTSWANSTNSFGNGWYGARTNQINVYLDLNTSSNVPPTHTTLDGTQQLSGSNMIDTCVYGMNWIQRSVTVNVTTPGYYWLSFAADGANDSYGGQLDDIRLCRITCPASVKDNFPAAWISSSLLFEDTFESITVKNNYGLFGNVDISTSYGTSGSTSSGWPNTAKTGWRISQVNQVNASYYQPTQGNTSIELDADNNVGGVANSNRTITRQFLLDPGYYRANYYYRAAASFASLGSTVYCGATPTAANVNYLSGTGTGNTAYSGGGNGTWALNTNMVGVFMSHDQMASDPNYAAYNGVATYSNPDGSNTSSPAVPNNTLNLTNYDPNQVNPLLDICGYAAAWQTRTANIKIVKTGYYWLTLAALGTADNVGGLIDDVKLTALGSLYSSAPSAAVTIPVPGSQPGATIAYTGFTVTANPLTP